jgi:hypothetical protein
MACLEEIADFDDVIGSEKLKKTSPKKSTGKSSAKAAPKKTAAKKKAPATDPQEPTAPAILRIRA